MNTNAAFFAAAAAFFAAQATVQPAPIAHVAGNGQAIVNAVASGATDVPSIAKASGLLISQTRAALTRLVSLGVVCSRNGTYRLAR